MYRPTLVSQTNREPQDLQPPNHPRATSSPSLLSRISEPIHLQELPLVQNQRSIKKCSSNVTHSSRITERGRSQNRQYTWGSKQNLSKPSEMMEIESMQPSDRSSRLLKATTPRQPWPYKGGQKGTVNAERRILLSRISMTSRRTKSECPRPRADESAFAWASSENSETTTLSVNLVKTLEFLGIYTLDPKATRRSLSNSPACPEFPDSEWRNVITGKAVNLDAVLSRQLSTTNDDLRVEKFGELELSYGSVEPTKVVRNGGDWCIAWNRTVRATTFAFPHRLQELTGYGDYITSLFAVTCPSFLDRVISYDKAVRKCVGSVRNIELSDYQKFTDLKIAHMDSVGVSACSEGSTKKDYGKRQKRGKSWKRSEPCNKWNEGSCEQKKEDCRRDHVCNRCGKRGHKGGDCHKASSGK